MMHIRLLLALSLTIVVAQADLVCLGWGLINPLVGLICHFKSDTFQAAEATAVGAVKEAAQSVQHLAEFDLTHNPVSITYNFLSQTKNGGLTQGGQSLLNATKDFQDVTVGFGKETANQLIQIYDLAHWNDISFCLINGAGRLVNQARKSSRKRAGMPSVGHILGMADDCVSKKVKQATRPAVFKPTNPNQQIGSTISDIATLLIPVGAEEKAGAKAAQGAVDLAIPGSEETTRVVKWTGDQDGAAEHFTDLDEAEAVANSMEDPEWVKSNCRICGPPPATNAVTARTVQRRTRSSLLPRGNVMTSCCRAPAVRELPPNPDRAWIDDHSAWGSESAKGEITSFEDSEMDGPIYDPSEYQEITEVSLVPSPVYKLRDLTVADDVFDLQKDLDTLSTGLVPWSSELQGVTSSDTMFTLLRDIFTKPSTDHLFDALDIEERDGKLRLTTASDWWIHKTDPALKSLQDFVNAAVKQGLDTVQKLKKLSDEEMRDFRGNVEFFYVAPGEEAHAGVDPRGFHVDAGQMQFVAADTPGLIIRNSATGTGSRVPLVENSWQLGKCYGWDMEAFTKGGINGPTWHSVFGPEMAEKGRVSMVMFVSRIGSVIG